MKNEIEILQNETVFNTLKMISNSFNGFSKLKKSTHIRFDK